jgi:hypothetical protein
MIGLSENALEDLQVDHQVEVYTLTGKARLRVPIKTSSGRGSFGPAIALEYDSGEGNSTFGIGWTLTGIPSISLDTRRSLPTYRNDEDRYVYAGGQELVPCLRKQGDQWLPVVENRSSYRVQRFRSRIERSFDTRPTLSIAPSNGSWKHSTTPKATPSYTCARRKMVLILTQV